MPYDRNKDDNYFYYTSIQNSVLQFSSSGGGGGDDLNIFQAFQLRASSIKSMTPFHRPGGVDIRTNDDRRNSHDL